MRYTAKHNFYKECKSKNETKFFLIKEYFDFQ